MPSKSESPFPPDYRAARKAFIAACTRARADVISRAHLGRQGPDGKPMFIDSVALGPRDAKRAVLVIADGASASAGAAALLDEGLILPDGMRLVVVHALDPFGFMKVKGDPGWSRAMLRAIVTEDLSRVTELTVLGFGIAEDALSEVFPPDRNIRQACTLAHAPTDAAHMCKAVKAQILRA